MFAILKYPKEPERKGKISPYFARLQIKSKKYSVLEGSEESFLELQKIVVKNGGKIVFPVKIIIEDKGNK